MTVEVVIPSLRQGAAQRLVESLLRCDPAPDVVTVVSNETQPWKVQRGKKVRLLRFVSVEYSTGERDVALRQNAGIYSAECDVVVIQGDDQVAPGSMIGDVLTVMSDKDYLWGNHRLIDFTGLTLDDILERDPRTATSREQPEPPARHGHWSCYGGMFAARTEFIRDFGAFDMAFNGRHAQEDQQLGYRLMRREGDDKVLIHEPPFSWHDITLRTGDTRDREPWLTPFCNGCGPGLHDYTTRVIGGAKFTGCMRCPFLTFADDGGLLFRDEPLIRYRPDAVQTWSVWL